MCVTVTTVTGGRPDSRPRPGSIFWYDDVNNFYVFEIAPNGKASVWRRQRGKWLAQVDWQDADGANKGDGGVNELRVTTVGSDATFYVNGTEFEKLAGSPPENGQQIGLFAASPRQRRRDLRLRRPQGDQALARRRALADRRAPAERDAPIDHRQREGDHARRRWSRRGRAPRSRW